jgi:hypothetical protein
MEENVTSDKKKRSTLNWIAIVAGLCMCIIGTFSLCNDPKVNDALTEAGAAQACTALIAEYPDSAVVLSRVADGLEAAVAARTTSPDALANVVSDAVSELTGQATNVDAFVKAIVGQFNAAHKASKTEEEYLRKVNMIIAGIRSTLD